MKILASLEKQNRSLLVFAGFVLIGVIGFVDYLTGYEFAFSVFYVLPITLITWIASRSSSSKSGSLPIRKAIRRNRLKRKIWRSLSRMNAWSNCPSIPPSCYSCCVGWPISFSRESNIQRRKSMNVWRAMLSIMSRCVACWSIMRCSCAILVSISDQ